MASNRRPIIGMQAIFASINQWWGRIPLLFKLGITSGIDDIESCDVLMICHDVNRSINLRGKAYAPLLDSIKEDFESRGLVCRSVANFGSLLIGGSAYGDPISINGAYIWHRLTRKVFNIIGIPCKSKNNPFARILKKTGARLIIAIGSRPELSSAAKSGGVFHVELLHGIGYPYLPWGWDKLSSEMLPNGILSLDEVSTKSFTPLLDKGVEIQTIPHPFLKRFTTCNIKPIPSEWKAHLNCNKNYAKRILVSLNWGYAGDHGPHFSNILSNGLFFDEVWEMVEEQPEIFWHFRFHPVHLRKVRYKKLLKFMDEIVLKNPNSEWREASRVPFASIANLCDGNIGMSSMSCYDAAAMGLPSLMLCPNIQRGGVFQNYFVDLVAEGYVTKAKINKEFLRSWISQTCKIEPRLSNLKDDVAWELAVKWMLEKSGINN